MTTQAGPVPAVRAGLLVPVASFRDPMFPRDKRCLPVPPPSTLRGMLAAATGRAAEPVPLGISAHPGGGGTDDETYHPVLIDGHQPTIRGRRAPVKGGMTIRAREFLAWLEVTIWVPGPDADLIGAALRRPVWGLRLGRSQDLAYLRSVTLTELSPAGTAVVGHALAPPGGHADPSAIDLRLAAGITPDRLTAEYRDYLWCAEPGRRQAVTGAYRDGEQAVWLDPPPDAGPGLIASPPWRLPASLASVPG
jgi:CRISPR-associated Cas5-like protein